MQTLLDSCHIELPVESDRYGQRVKVGAVLCQLTPYFEAQINGYSERERTEAALGIRGFVLAMGSFVLFSQRSRENRSEEKTHQHHHANASQLASSGKTVRP